MKSESMEEAGFGDQRHALNASAEMDGAANVRAGETDNWRGMEASQVGQEPARTVPNGTPNVPEDQPGADPPSDGVERGMLDDWIRNVEPDNPTNTSGEPHPSAGESPGASTDVHKEEVIMRDGVLRD